MKLQEAISIILKEWQIQHKNEISKDIGSIKKVYPLKSNPDYIIKTFPRQFKKDIEGEERFYKEYPNLYAKIIKINYEKGWMIQERLDTKSFKEELKKVSNDLLLYTTKTGSSEFEHVQFVVEHDPDLFEELYNGKNEFVNSLLRFYSEVEKINYKKVSLKYIDAHIENLGIDKNGNIKLLDI